MENDGIKNNFSRRGFLGSVPLRWLELAVWR